MAAAEVLSDWALTPPAALSGAVTVTCDSPAWAAMPAPMVWFPVRSISAMESCSAAGAGAADAVAVGAGVVAAVSATAVPLPKVMAPATAAAVPSPRILVIGARMWSRLVFPVEMPWA